MMKRQAVKRTSNPPMLFLPRLVSVRPPSPPTSWLRGPYGTSAMVPRVNRCSRESPRHRQGVHRKLLTSSSGHICTSLNHHPLTTLISANLFLSRSFSTHTLTVIVFLHVCNAATSARRLAPHTIVVSFSSNEDISFFSSSAFAPAPQRGVSIVSDVMMSPNTLRQIYRVAFTHVKPAAPFVSVFDPSPLFCWYHRRHLLERHSVSQISPRFPSFFCPVPCGAISISQTPPSFSAFFLRTLTEIPWPGRCCLSTVTQQMISLQAILTSCLLFLSCWSAVVFLFQPNVPLS